MKKKIGIILLIIISIMLVGGIAYNVYAKYVLSKRVSISFNTSDYYFDVSVNKTEITSLPATVNVTVKNHNGTNFTDTDLQYSLEASNPKLDIQVSENMSTLKGGSKQEKTFTVKIDTKQGIEWAKEDLQLKLNISKPYTDSKEIALNIDYKSENITVDITDGMIPVKYVEGTGWEKTTEFDREWYNYREKKWANVVLKDSTFNGNILDETKPYSMLVYIPRYAYQITSLYHQASSGAGNINIEFIDKNNQTRERTKTYSAKYPSYQTGSGMKDYVVHPAFTFGDKELNGIWVGKFETSHTGCTTDKATGEIDTNVTTLTLQIKAGVTSWRNIHIDNMLIVSTEMNKNRNPYGLNISDSVVDPHMIKNSEWGAIAYLSQNAKYGKGSEVWINPNNNYITGQAGSSVDASSTARTDNYKAGNGSKASTTGNTTGIYDMNGGSWERVAAYIANGHKNLTNKGISINTPNKYRDVYESTVKDGTNAQASDYNLTEPVKKGKYGDAIWETSGGTGTSSPSNKQSWYSDYSNFPYMSNPFFNRGGDYHNTSGAGIFFFGYAHGDADVGVGFRVVVPVL